MNFKEAKSAPAYLVIFSLFFISQVTSAAPRISGFQPELGTQLSYEDNVRRSPKSNRQSDTILAIKPTLPLAWRFGKHKLDLTYKGGYAQYLDQSILNYDDHKLNSRLSLNHSYRLNSEFDLGHTRGHYIPADNNIAATNLTTAPHLWKENYIKASLVYGKASSQGQLITKLEHRQRGHTNNNLQVLDTNRTSLSATLYYRVSSKTRLPFEVGISQYDYQNIPADNSPNSTGYRYLAGISWDATAKTTGILQFGWLDKKYDHPRFNDTAILMLKLDGIWKPNTYTKVIFGVLRDTQESLRLYSNAYIQNHVRTEITHMLTTRTKLTFSARYTAAEEDSAEARKDNRLYIRAEAWQKLRRWLDVGVSYKDIARKSDYKNLGFDAHIFMFEAKVNFNQ